VTTILCVLNFVVFLAGDIVLGGSAVNGKIEGGRFFLGSHGRLTEVNEATFYYSKWHCYSVFVTHPLAMASAFWYNFIAKRQP